MVASVRDGLAIAWAKCVGDGMVSNADVAGSAWSTVAVLGAVGRRAAGKPGYGSALGQQALGATVYAEIDPSQKERIIRALRRGGSVVGYLGDGINDAPALQPVSKRPGCLSPGRRLASATTAPTWGHRSAVAGRAPWWMPMLPGLWLTRGELHAARTIRQAARLATSSVERHARFRR
jgi:hypothetical protein